MATSMMRRGSEITPEYMNFGGNLKNDPKLAKKINVELVNAKTKYDGLIKLKRLLAFSDENVVIENISTWLKTLPQIILQVDDIHGCQFIAAENFKLLLSQACQISSVSREISTNLVPGVLMTFLQSEYKDGDGSVLTAIESLLINYPSSCGALRSRLVKYVMPLMMSSSTEMRAQAIRCWARVPFLGGGGSQRSTHLQQWQGQFDQTAQSLKFAFRIFMGEDSEEILDPCIGSQSLPLTALPFSEPGLSYCLIQRICTLCECLVSLLNVNFPYAVSIPVNTVMQFIFDVLDIVPARMGNTTEMLQRASCLNLIQESVLELFGKLTKICKRNLCQFSSKINQMFSALLDMWKDKNPVTGKNKKHNQIRTKIYGAIIQWLQNCGPTCRFLGGLTHLNQSILQHLVDDITPIKDILKVSSSTIQSNNSKKAKRRRFAEATQDLLNGSSSDRIHNSTANSELCTAALNVISHSVTVMEHRLSSNIHKTLQEIIITTILHIQQGVVVHPYSRCTLPRLMLYKVLLALTMSPVPDVAPPIAIATKGFTSALSNEKNTEIRSFCREAIASMSNIVHPWRSAWHTCSVLVDNTDVKNTETITPIIEPMNVEMNIFNRDEQRKVVPNGFGDELEKHASVGSPVVQHDEEVEGNVITELTKAVDDLSEDGSVHESDQELENETIVTNTESGNNEVTEDTISVDEVNRYNDVDNNYLPSETANGVKNPAQNSSGYDTNEACDDEKDEDSENKEEVNKMLLDFVDAPADEEA